MIVPLTCTLTGISFGEITISNVPGRQPYCTAFNETILLHPIFSLPLPKTLALFRNSLERQLEGTSQDDTLELSFLAILRSLKCLKVPQVHNPILPTRTTVLSNGHKLITVARWHIARPSFIFPVLVLSPINTNEKLENIQDYLTLLVDLMASADKKKETFDDEERSYLQATAVASIRRPEKLAKKSLWRWCENHILHSQWKTEAEKLHRLFFATQKEVTRMDREELEFLLTTLESILPLGTPLLTEVRKHCEGLLTMWENHFKDFWIVETVAEMWNKAPLPPVVYVEKQTTLVSSSAKPEEKDYATRHGYIIALARWNLANQNERRN